MSNLSLYQIAGEYREAADKLAELDLDPTTFADTLESLGGDLEEKSKNTAFVVRNLEAAADQIDAAVEEMGRRAATIRKNAERVREYLMSNMIFAGVKKLETPYFVITVRDNPPKVVVTDEQTIPPQFFVEPPPPPAKLDKKGLAAALKAGEQIEGAHLERGQSLQIK
jgi:Siphovirus Gp157